MSTPTDFSVGSATWSQGEDNEAGLEIRIPSIIPDKVRARDISVEIKDSTVLCVSHAGKRLLQWRLYAPVKNEVEWRVDNLVIVVELEKKTPTVWSCLLDLPIPKDDPLLTPLEEINRMFIQYFPALPPLTPQADSSSITDHENIPQKVNNNSDNIKEGKDNDDLLEKVLEEVAAEVVATKEKGEDISAQFVKAELENYKQEEEEVRKKMTELKSKLDSAEDSDSVELAKRQIKILDKILSLHNECRTLRSQPASLDNFIRCTQLDLQKARANLGLLDDSESEDYINDNEKSLSATELMKHGLTLLEEKDIKSCMHFFRLAAINHQHDQSIMLLYNIYTQLESPSGASLLLNRALDDKNASGMVNQKVGELYDKGERHFLPLFPAALYFFERAAKLGNVSAMLNLAHLWLRGSTESTLASEEQVNLQKDIQKYHAWVEKAIDRGCGSAYFVKGCMHLEGEHGLEKSYKKAKFYLDAASTAQPELSKRALQLPAMLERLRKEEEGSVAITTRPNRTPTVQDSDNVVQVTPSVARLNLLSKTSPSDLTAGPIRRTKKSFTGSASRKAFWEKLCVVGVSLYGVYSLAFPLRVMILPLFYSMLFKIVERIPCLGNKNSDFSLF